MRSLREEFPDVSISKIRFLEDEGLLSPQRTRGGYRLFSEHDVERLVTILRLQRDEFLPLRVIRDELATPGAAERKRRKPAGVGERVAPIDFDELCRRAGVQPEFAKELEEFGLLAPRRRGRGEAVSRDGRRHRGRLRAAHALRRRRRAICARSGRRPTARRRCSSSSSRRRSARATPNAARPGCSDLQSLTELAQELAALLLWREVREVGST